MRKLIEKILKYISILFAILLLLSYLSVHISPAHFWPLAFFGLAYPFLLIINIFFLLLWLIKWKRAIFIPVFALLLGITHIKNSAPNIFRKKVEFETEKDRELKVLSYNVRAFNIYEWMNDPNTNKGIFNFIRSEHPDVICLQEFFTSSRAEFSTRKYDGLFGETPYKYIEYSKSNKDNTGFGLATFSRYPIVNQGVVFKQGGNQSIYTDILFNEDTMRIFNCHLQSVNLRLHNYEFLDSLRLPYDEQQVRELQDLSIKLKHAYIKRAEQAKKLSAEIKNSPHPVVLCGDFNDTPVSFSYRRIKGKMKDAWQMAGRGFGNTYLGRLPLRIDYIFYDNSFSAVDFERVRTQLSDHYPIIAILRKKGEEGGGNGKEIGDR